MSRILRLQTLTSYSSVREVGADNSTASAGLCSSISAGLCSSVSAGLCGADADSL